MYVYVCIKKSINNFKATWYNLRKCAVEHACKFTSVHIKNKANFQLFSS